MNSSSFQGFPGHRSDRREKRLPSDRGFALVVSLSLMLLMTVLAVGLLSLSTISLRAAGRGEAAAVARNHARLGLVLAIGQLQRDLGPDRRISAPASAVDLQAKQPHLLGAWESWKWDPAQSPSPDYSGKAGKFRGWLISTADAANAIDPNFPAGPEAGDSAELVGDLENHGLSTSVRAAKIATPDSRIPGRFAWAVFDESTKAAIDLGDPDQPQVTGEEIASRFAPGRFRADLLDPALSSLEKPSRLVTLETAVIPGGSGSAAAFRKRFHDFTVGSIGLLADAANGSLKTDLTPLFEAPAFPAAAFPGDTLYSTVTAGAPRWSYLYDHYRKYKILTLGTAGTPRYTPTTTDLKITAGGTIPSPQTERLIPVIAKMQILFSVVSHHAHIGGRINGLNNLGVPKGNDKHAVPHLAYEPVITLLNPYDVALDLKKLRIRVWDPPVGFRFAKVDKEKGTTAWYRQEMANGEYHGLARFNYSNERNPSARRSFTLLLTDGTGEKAGTSLRLEPGEVKVFSSRVEKDWSWGFECQNEWEPRSFFDWGADRNFGNIDRRTSNQFGVEAVPGWDTRAGLQTDHMSYGGGRPDNTKYQFEIEHGMAAGFVSIRMTDEVTVEARAERCTGGDSSLPDFQVDVLAGTVTEPTQDLLRSYKFRFAKLSDELSENPGKPVIKRTYNVGQTIQKPGDKTLGFKKPFAVLEMSARTTKDPLDDSKAWLYNNPVVEGADQSTSVVGAANQSYDLRLLELTSYTSFPGVEIDPDTKRGYFGASRTSTEGTSQVPMFRVPVAPAASLGELIPANLVSGGKMPRVVHPFGNSRAHPLLASDTVTRTLSGGTLLDHSYLINDALWDRYFFSSATAYSGGVLAGNRSRREVLEGILSGTRPGANARLATVSPGSDPAKLAGQLDALDDTARSALLAAHLGVRGPFNLNSTSTDAWRAVLSSLRDREVAAWKNRATSNIGATPFARGGLPLAGPKDAAPDTGVQGQIRWAGYRSLDDGQIEDLAEAIVGEIARRGSLDQAPALSVAEFVNRRPGGPGDLHSLAGLLQTAIDLSGVNAEFHALDSLTLSSANLATARKRGALTLAAMDGNSAEGAPPILTQGDLMAVLAPVATVRGDTFKIRAYGEANGPDGTTVLARAWCEATVQRIPGFVDPADPAEAREANITSDANRRFGRRFEIVSFRWLNPDEI